MIHTFFIIVSFMTNRDFLIYFIKPNKFFVQNVINITKIINILKLTEINKFSYYQKMCILCKPHVIKYGYI